MDAPGRTADIAVTIRSGDWTRACPEAAAAAESAARLALLRATDAPAIGQGRGGIIIDITLTDDGEQQRLNRDYRGQDRPTNVLAFPGADPELKLPPGVPAMLGDVVLALATIRREADEQQKPVADHLRHLVVHGVLHLLGYDHQTETDAAAMEAREIAILAELGVPDPYRDTI